MEDRTSKQTEDKEPSLGLPPLGYTSNLAFFHLHTKCRILRIYYSEELRKWLLYQKEVTTKWHVDNFLKKSCNAGVKCFFFSFWLSCHPNLHFQQKKLSNQLCSCFLCPLYVTLYALPSVAMTPKWYCRSFLDCLDFKLDFLPKMRFLVRLATYKFLERPNKLSWQLT